MSNLKVIFVNLLYWYASLHKATSAAYYGLGLNKHSPLIVTENSFIDMLVQTFEPSSIVPDGYRSLIYQFITEFYFNNSEEPLKYPLDDGSVFEVSSPETLFDLMAAIFEGGRRILTDEELAARNAEAAGEAEVIDAAEEDACAEGANGAGEAVETTGEAVETTGESEFGTPQVVSGEFDFGEAPPEA